MFAIMRKSKREINVVVVKDDDGALARGLGDRGQKSTRRYRTKEVGHHT
jgi:hypothetical protein